MNSFGRFGTLGVCGLGVLTLGIWSSPVNAQATTPLAVETPDPYFKGALEPIKVTPEPPQVVSRSYNFQPAAPSGMSPSVLEPITAAPTPRVASSPWPAPTSNVVSGDQAKPIKGPIVIPPLPAAEVWYAPNTPVSGSLHHTPQPTPHSSQNIVPRFNGFSAAPIPLQNSAPIAKIQSASPTPAPQSIIREQSAPIKPNQFSPNGFQPIQIPAPPKSIAPPRLNSNEFNPNLSSKTAPKASIAAPRNIREAGSKIQQASFIASTDDSSQFQTPDPQLIKQVEFVQPAIAPVKQEKKFPFEAGKVVAIVGGEPIFVGDMLFEINQLIERFIAKAPADIKERERQKMIGQILPKFIEAKLLYHGMLSQLPEGVDIEQVLAQASSEFDKKAMPKMMEAAGVESMPQFDAYLRSLGSSLRDMRQSWARDQMTKYFLSQKLIINTEVTHQELLENYRENKSNYAVIAKARWEQIMIRFDRSDSRETAKSEINRLSNQIVHGANLAALAKKSSHGFLASQGGQQDWTSEGSLVLKELDETIFSLPIGKLSNIIETRDGFHVVRVLERTNAGHTSFLEAQVEIKKKITEARRKKAYDDHLAELRSQIPVEYLINSEAIAKLNGKNKQR